ncbi:hypothetical protein [Actinophytocola sp.]|uniref:hypothetical protein n=1 Tax=Actinophytocola sp. TaxID=1872138 RepID=UPI003899EDCF
MRFTILKAFTVAAALVGVGMSAPVASAATVYDAPHVYGLDCSAITDNQSVRWEVPRDNPLGDSLRIRFMGETGNARTSRAYDKFTELHVYDGVIFRAAWVDMNDRIISRSFTRFHFDRGFPTCSARIDVNGPSNNG